MFFKGWEKGLLQLKDEVGEGQTKVGGQLKRREISCDITHEGFLVNVWKNQLRYGAKLLHGIPALVSCGNDLRFF